MLGAKGGVYVQFVFQASDVCVASASAVMCLLALAILFKWSSLLMIIIKTPHKVGFYLPFKHEMPAITWIFINSLHRCLIKVLAHI